LGPDNFDVTITIKDPWTYETLSNEFLIDHIPNGNDYGRMIVNMLTIEHPHLTLTWEYHRMDQRIIITTSKYGIAYVDSTDPESNYPWQKLFNDKENKSMEHHELRLVKLVTSGPATIGWFGTPYKRDLMKVVVKRAEGEYDDPEKAILALYMKALSGGHTPFHSRMNKAMKMMYAAIDKEREIEEDKLAREEKRAQHSFGEDVVEQFKETFNATEVSQEIATNINNSLNRLTSYANRLKETVKKIELNSVYGANNAKVENKGEPWTWDEISFLNRHYNSKSTKSIAMALGRSEYAVRSKAKRLGIKKGGKTNG
jgi:hypothetical protein